MTETFSRLVWAVLPSLLVALYMAQYNLKQKKKEMNIFIISILLLWRRCRS